MASSRLREHLLLSRCSMIGRVLRHAHCLHLLDDLAGELVVDLAGDLLEVDIDGVHCLIGGAARKQRSDGGGGNKMCQAHRHRSIKKIVERGVPVSAVHRESIFPYTSQNINPTKAPYRKRSKAHEYGQGWTARSIFTLDRSKPADVIKAGVRSPGISGAGQSAVHRPCGPKAP